MVLALLRDAAVAPRLAAPPLAPLQATSAVQAALAPPTALTVAVAAAAAAGTAGGSGSSTGSSGLPLWPPSGVLPYRGLCLLAAPLCYLYDRPAASYRLLRALYCRCEYGMIHRCGCRMATRARVDPDSAALHTFSAHKKILEVAHPLIRPAPPRPAPGHRLPLRHWCRLHSLSAAGPPSPALPGLLRVFEAAMQVGVGSATG